MIKWVRIFSGYLHWHQHKNCLLLLSFCLVPNSLFALQLSDSSNDLIELNQYVRTLHDPKNQYTPEQALIRLKDNRFISDRLDFNGKQYWFYLPLNNTSQQTAWTLLASNMLFDDIHFYWQCDGKELVKIDKPNIGMDSPSLSISYYIDLHIPAHQQCGLLQEIRVSAFYPLQNYLMPSSQAQAHSNLQVVLCIIAIGVLVGLLVYNALLSITLWSWNYVLYSVYALVNLAFILLIAWRPLSDYYHHWPAVNSFRVLSGSVMILFIAFTVRFMQPGLEVLKQAKGNQSFIQFYETLYRWRWLPYLTMLIFIVEPILYPVNLGLSAKYYPPLYIICSLYIPVLSLSIALAGFRPAWVFLTAWSILIGSNILGTLDLVGVIELNGWARIIAILAASLEMMILSIALGLSVRASQKAEDRARLARENAEMVMAEKDRFFSTLSHEIRTPLHAILGANDLLAKTNLDEKQQAYRDSTHYAAESMVAIVDNLLDRAELKDSQQLEQDTVFDSERLLQTMVQLLKPRAEEKKLQLELNTQLLPEKLLGKPLIVRRLLINLIGNAIKYTKHGHINVFVEWLSGQERLLISVQDSGQGISSEQLKNLSERFNRSVESHYSHDASSGLGLAICNEMLNSCDGKLSIESELGQGTVVKATLTMHAAATQPSPLNQTSIVQPRKLPIHVLKESHVLIVDDIASNRMIAHEIIRHLGCQVSTAEDAFQALEQLQQKAVTIVFSDLRMPGMDGEMLFQKMNLDAVDNSKKRPYFILTSAHFNAQQIEQFQQRGIDQCLAKPYRPEQLEQLILELLSDSQEQTAFTDIKHTQPIQARLGQSKYRQLITLFVDQLDQDLGRINESMAQKKWPELNIAAHRIVSAARALSFNQVALAASQLEDSSMDFDMVNTQQVQRQFKTLVKESDTFKRDNCLD